MTGPSEFVNVLLESDYKKTNHLNLLEKKMLLTNTEEIPGKTIVAFHGIVSGSTVRAKHVGKDMMAG